MKKVIKKMSKVTATKSPVLSKPVVSVIEPKLCTRVDKLNVSFGNGELNQVVEKLNEIIEVLNKCQ